MSHARTALGELAALTHLLARKPALPDISRCREQAEAQSAPDSAATSPSDGVLEKVRHKLSSACATEGGAASVDLPTLRLAPWVLWHGEPQAAGFPGLLDTILREAQRRPRWLRDLIEAWLRDFAPDRITLARDRIKPVPDPLKLQETGFAIAGLLADTTHPRLTAWRYAHERFSIFDANEGPRCVGHALSYGPDEPATVLSRTGMDDPLRANGGFFRAAVAEIVLSLPKALRAPSGRAAWSRTADLLEVKQTRLDKFGREVTVAALRFADFAGETARACLDPWLRGGTESVVPQDEIKVFLLRVLGDPRVEAARWATAGEQATGLMRVWLAKASLEAFLSLISQDNDASQWRARQKFWRACLERMPSAEVWIVLGPGLADRARTLRDLVGGFGEMDAHGQGVLLMKMGNLILSEWSNVGALRAWTIGSAGCPKLYERHYDARNLKAPSLTFPHQAPGDCQGLRHSGSWQERAAALLFERLKIRLTPGDYQ